MSKKIYFKNLVVAFCLLLIAKATLAQNPLWSLPPNYWKVGVGGTIALPTPGGTYGYDGSNPQYSSNMYADAAGNPLFFINNASVFNSQGYLIDSLYISSGVVPGGLYGAGGWAENCVVPNPGNCKQYFVFTAAFNDTSSLSSSLSGYSPFYALIDVSVPNPNVTGQLGKNITNSSYPGSNGGLSPLYAITTNSVSGGFPSAQSPVYAASKVRSDGSRFVFMYDGNYIWIFKISNTGVLSCTQGYFCQSLSFNTCIAGPWDGGLTGSTVSEMELYEDAVNGYYKIAMAGGGTVAWGGCMIMNFNISDGSYVNNSGRYFSAGTGSYTSYFSNVAGLEFSRNGKWLYFTHEPNANYSATLEAISTGNPCDKPDSLRYTISSDTAYISSQIEVGWGADTNNLYLVNSRGYLAQIAGANSPTTAALTATYLSISYAQSPGSSNSLGFGYNTPAMYYLPDQIDQEKYGSQFNSNTACCLFYYSGYDQYTYSTALPASGYPAPANPSTLQTWSANTVGHINNPLAAPGNLTDSVTIGEELRIAAGTSVLINNMKLKFSPQARLILENAYGGNAGGVLSLSNCTLTVTNPCGTDMWPGIQLWGNPALAQSTTANQSKLYAYNNTIIENAYVGVLAGFDTSWLSNITPRPPVPSITGTGYTYAQSGWQGATTGQGCGGGIVELVNCTFLNNQRAVVLYNYSLAASTFQRFTTSHFLVNSALLNSSVAPTSFVSMYNHNDALGMLGCSFYDSYNAFTDTGINTFNSAYSLDLSGTKHNSFTNLLYGIYSYNTPGNTATISAKNSTFNDNFYGIYLGYVNNAIVETDSFRIFQTTCTGHCIFHPNSYGLYLDNSTGYSVRANGFTKYGSTTPTNSLYGIVANNTGQHSNRIFSNNFDHLNVGNQAQYVNYIRQSTTPHNGAGGLVYLCNSLSNISWYDFFVPSSDGDNIGIGTGSAVDSSGISYAQGTATTPGSIPTDPNYPVTGGNQFSHTSGGYDFYIDTIALAYASNYVYCSNTGTGCGSAYNAITRQNVTISGVATPVTCSVNTYTCSGCRTTNATTDPLQAMQNQADAFKQVYDSMSTVIDGGNSQALLSLIAGDNNPQAVYNSLNAVAPYLSNTVLTAYLNSTYPASYIAQLLSTCSPLTVEVKAALKTSALSAGIKSQLAVLQNDSSKVVDIYLRMAAALSARHNLLNDLIRTYIHDTIPANQQKAYDLMKVEALELPARVQVEVGIDLQDEAMASAALTQVANAEGQSNFVKLHTILVQNLGKTPKQILIDGGNLSAVQTLAADSSDRNAYFKSNALLMAIGKSKYVPYIIPAKTTNANTQTAQRTETVQALTTTAESSLYNAPNPFKDNTNVKATIVEKTQNAYIVITDMVGNEIARYPLVQGENNISIQANGLEQAVMFCTLVVDGVKIKTNKMVLIK